MSLLNIFSKLIYRMRIDPVAAFVVCQMLLVPHAMAQSHCPKVFDVESALVSNSFQSLGLTSPEVEAKFSIPTGETYDQLKGLVGREVTLTDLNGEKVVFVFTMNKEHIYRDVYFDTKDKKLFYGRAMLRARVRYDRRPPKIKYKLAKAVFQSKGAESLPTGLERAVFARNEIRGREYLDLNWFLKKQKEILSSSIQDDAVDFARDLVGTSQTIRPVLFIESERFFLSLKKKNADALNSPWFYISIDKVKYRGLQGKKEEAQTLELEAELNDNLALLPHQEVESQLHLLDEVTRFLVQEFHLVPSTEAKYQSGVQLTVLP